MIPPAKTRIRHRISCPASTRVRMARPVSRVLPRIRGGHLHTRRPDPRRW
ncbi:hypothetical protein GQ600_243 [Phytophthora cactorum]|nr:hypothetical protein GQ600_243 [Phytophthora cactorum]